MVETCRDSNCLCCFTFGVGLFSKFCVWFQFTYYIILPDHVLNSLIFQFPCGKDVVELLVLELSKKQQPLAVIPRKAWRQLETPLRKTWGIQTPQQLFQLPQNLLERILGETDVQLEPRDPRRMFCNCTSIFCVPEVTLWDSVYCFCSLKGLHRYII